MKSEAVRKYVEQSKSILEASPQMDEENTKVRLVQPFIELLGWNIYSTEVELEYPVQMGTQQSKVDYALMLGDTPVVFIEAKSARSDLSEHNVSQLRSYMRQALNVDWGILTNGKQFEVFSKNGNYESGEETSIASFHVNRLTETPEILEILSKESIQSGRADEIATQIAETNQAIQYLDDREGQIAEQLAGIIHDELGSVPINLEEQSIEFVQELRSALRDQRQFLGNTTEADRDTDSDKPITSVEASNTDRSHAKSDTDGNERYVIEIGNDKTTLATLSGENQTDALHEAVNYLIENHDLISKIEPLPYIPGREKAIINDEPTSPHDEEAMRVYRELPDSNYIDTHMSKEGKKRHLRKLTERCDLEVEFAGEW
ncbi:type I restriction enzyme HsdR N-terminal domain-containing protein [Natrinema limicola]|uniref:Type I restriction enzyme R protein N-terminal domain-containing protein n=1 Tax=Natrinema limicola JCM 13563 TaxID=1230457 RepID=M0CVH6_9EURY|nr:type I restriction enzyme HsdR N-terminal domain-containing protein [Natrinema limicola]ELZ25894.1 hypothetical protein C476_00547 [Natrinema limicola JCM 13563]